MRNYLLLLLLLLLPLLPACYHMRAEAEPIAPRVITLPGGAREAVRKIRKLVERDWKCRILETDSSGTVLITAPYHFTTDTGFGQPAGGRKYYTQLRIEVQQQNGTVVVSLSHYNFEIRTSYAYNKDGQVGTMYKHYPYEEYPGMFDLDLINHEMDRVAADILRIFQEYR
ncbi:MAG: lipoprotein [Desulfuromonadaceae bacterium]